jgi:hypothetical protein
LKKVRKINNHKVKDLYVKETIFQNLCCTGKVWKANPKKTKGLSAKDLRFNKLQNYFSKEKSYGICPRSMDQVNDGWSTGPWHP